MFFRGLDVALFAVSVETSGAGSFRADAPARVLGTRYVIGGPFQPRQYDVSPDGTRFLMMQQNGAAEDSPRVANRRPGAELDRGTEAPRADQLKC